MSLEQPTPKDEPLDVLKNEAAVGGLPLTQVFSSQKDFSPAPSAGHPLDRPKKAALETDQTVVSSEPPLEIVSASEADEKQPRDARHELPIPLSGLQLSSGMMLGPFTVTKFIGGGGMGRVYLGLDKSLDRKVALKVLQRQRAQDQASVARFMNEAKSAARLNHEHIAQVYFAGQQDDIPFIAFEFVEGTNIRTIVENQGVFPLSQAMTYLIQITHALDHAALHGVIHRDVKPSNILITQEGRAKLIDMGLARLLKPTDPGDELTASGVTLGTFDYISPEQARDPRNADIRSDIYSLGCTFFFMLTGRPPFHEGTVLQKLLQHQGDEPPDIRYFLPGAPPEVAHILQKMMAKDPRQRYQTPASLLTELTNVAAKLGLRPSKHGKTVWTMRSPPEQSVLLTHIPWIVGFVLFLTVFVFLNWFWPQKIVQPPSIPTTVVNTSGNGEELPTDLTLLVPRQEWPLRYWEENVRNRSDSPSQTNCSFSPTPRYSASLGVGLFSETLALRAYATNTESSVSLTATFPTRSTGSDNNPPAQSTVLIVDPFNFRDQEGIYSNLGAAISVAGKNAIIELRFNGSANMKIEPMSLVGKQLTIQAGKDFTPVVQFKPLDSSSVVKEEGRTFLFLVNGGSIRFHRIAFEMEVSRNVLAEKWSLFDMLGPSQLFLSDCSITVRNTRPGSQDVYHEGVSVFRVAQSTDSEPNAVGLFFRSPNTGSHLNSAEISLLESESIPSDHLMAEKEKLSGGIAVDKNDPPVNQITLNNCIVRGETTVLSVEAKRSVQMDVNNAFFATDLPFVSLQDIPGVVRERERTVNLSMQYVSLYCKSKLNRFIKRENSYPLSVKWLAKYSVFRLHNTPINEFFGFMTQEELRPEYSEWDGDLAFFQDVSSFAEIKASSSVTYPIRLFLEDWKTRWNSPPTVNVDIFQQSLLENRTVNRMVPTDLAIRIGSPAYQTVSRPESDPQMKIDAGQIYELLPKL
ncbi:MAG: serine/threonine protein kinase [Planctomycetaceae bacterium]|nr:serine/threonine protein kinase [Planctomycetaceae bacterium]